MAKTKRDKNLYDKLRKGGERRRSRLGYRRRCRERAKVAVHGKTRRGPALGAAESIRDRACGGSRKRSKAAKKGSDSKGERRQTPERSSQTQTQGSQELDSPF